MANNQVSVVRHGSLGERDVAGITDCCGLHANVYGGANWLLKVQRRRHSVDVVFRGRPRRSGRSLDEGYWKGRRWRPFAVPCVAPEPSIKAAQEMAAVVMKMMR